MAVGTGSSRRKRFPDTRDDVRHRLIFLVAQGSSAATICEEQPTDSLPLLFREPNPRAQTRRRPRLEPLDTLRPVGRLRSHSSAEYPESVRLVERSATTMSDRGGVVDHAVDPHQPGVLDGDLDGIAARAHGWDPLPPGPAQHAAGIFRTTGWWERSIELSHHPDAPPAPPSRSSDHDRDPVPASRWETRPTCPGPATVAHSRHAVPTRHLGSAPGLPARARRR